MIAVNVAFTFPLQVNPCRNSCHLLYQQLQQRLQAGGGGGGDRKSKSKSGGGGSLDKKEMSTQFLLVTSVSICALAWLVAFFVHDLGVVLGIVGATGSTLISYILPGLFYWSLHRERSATRYAAFALMCWGLVVVPVCLTGIALGGSAH